MKAFILLPVVHMHGRLPGYVVDGQVVPKKTNGSSDCFIKHSLWGFRSISKIDALSRSHSNILSQRNKKKNKRACARAVAAPASLHQRSDRLIKVNHV